MKVLISTSATARQQSNAKAVFGSKSVSILKALEEASKEKTLNTAGLDALLADLKLSGAEFEKVSAKASFVKAVAAAKSFATAKTFSAKIAALKSIKYAGASASVAAVAAKTPKAPSKLDGLMDSLFDKANSQAFKKSFGLTLPSTANFGVGANYAVRTDGGYFYVQLFQNGPIAMLVSDPTPYLDKKILGISRKPGQSVAFIDSNTDFTKGEEGFGPVNGYFNPDKSTLKVIDSDDEAIAYFKSICAKLKTYSSKSSKSITTYGDLMEAVAENENEFGSESQKAYDAFSSIFGFTPKPGSQVGIGSSSDDEGIYYNVKENLVLCQARSAPSVAYALSVNKPDVFIVYKDSYKDEGPFLGEVRPVPKTKKVFTSITGAMAYFSELAAKM